MKNKLLVFLALVLVAGVGYSQEETKEDLDAKLLPAPMPEMDASWDNIVVAPRTPTIEDTLLTAGETFSPREIVEAAPTGSIDSLTHAQLHGIILKTVEARTKPNQRRDKLIKDLVAFCNAQNELNKENEGRIEALEARLEKCGKKGRRGKK